MYYFHQKLPKLESNLYTLVDEYESDHKSTFLVYGFTLREFMDNAREKYEVEKENLKLARVSKILFELIFLSIL